ncbi:bifunctional riboflavin kinase/FAD synthetase [Sulfuriflexus sp.]|uniref:bifunctional riboflavin kinase/FAD synthetase n=1 Tax=Sulfuriflexus sp. TaxID=2015443 RepID=UPI0028CE40DC|nr:bifunctional riboflavin kinase/FAD synthetase [Sulfuriflexus sp.]MDT8403762.1 bifunctional riboflavin kinase/FAD synthetase [Sulfuriflexus sp.]
MELIRGYHNLRPRHRGCVATIGNFDGVHLGHQTVLGQLSEKAAELGVPSVVISFEPYPMEFFAPDKAPARLTRLREKIRALARYAVDRLLCLRFDAEFAAQPAEEFIEHVLLKGLDVRYLVVGDDFRFGKDRRGDFALLRKAGEQHGFQVVNLHTFAIDGERVSSTRVREALAAGEIGQAEQLLGRPYRMCGRVAHGDKRGRTIGFPTANIHLHRTNTPIKGVFAVEMFGIEGEPVQGVANIGTRPTVDGTRSLLEVHLFDFDADIYGRNVSVEFVHKLRDEQQFASFEELRKQIDKDANAARAFFAQRE